MENLIIKTRFYRGAAMKRGAMILADPQQLACSGCFTRSRFDDAAQGAAPLLAACGGSRLRHTLRQEL
eukprot:1839105-Amphidinium_carterae.1